MTLPPTTQEEVGGASLPVWRFRVLVIGSGAAGLNCAEHLHELGVSDVAIVTACLGGGTSANAGSDKQTYYKLGVWGDVPDSPMDFARALTAGGMCHGDLAYVEALGSLPEFFHLVRNGVAFPHNRYGAYVGYKTDHDPRQRATSAGPKTSIQMVECSLANVRRYGIPILDGVEIIRLLTTWDGGRRRIVGALGLDISRLDQPDMGVVAFVADYVVLAAGGPGELYAASAYPPGQVGGLGLGLEVGCPAANLTESQFGLASLGFRWNLSGSYQQVIPCYFSTDESGGDTRYFLNEYFPEMVTEAGAIFRKGYQWPFHAEHLSDFGSSLVDLAVWNETRSGRRVFLDFSRNPVATGGLEPFALDALDPEARGYLQRSGATQATPLERLRHMNPLAVEVFAEKGVDLSQPLAVAVCAQHCNGGLAVDLWWQTPVLGLFAIGEVAGTHGVRPGGCALNSGQVGGLRAAQWIAWHGRRGAPGDLRLRDAASQVAQELAELQLYRNPDPAAPSVGEVRREIQARMTEHGGFLRTPQGVSRALADAGALAARVAAFGQRISGPGQLVAAVQNEHLCRMHLAFLVAMKAYIERGGGSRGSALVVDESGERVVRSRRGVELIHRAERPEHREEILLVQLEEDGEFRVKVEPVRPLPEDDSWFETTWREWREGSVFATDRTQFGG